MYNDTIKAENKIITSNDLSQIFSMMNETLKKYQKISQIEEQQNYMLEPSYQQYTFKDEGSKMKVIVDFYDNTNIIFDKYENFAGVFYNRINEIKNIDISFTLNYTVITPAPNKTRNFYYQTIHLMMSENKMDISLNLNNEDRKLDELYQLIKNIIINAPEKYDNIIKKKNSITNTVGLAIGMIPGLILTSLLLFVPVVNNIFLKGYVVYPICCIFIAYFIGSMIASSKLEKYYKAIMPDKQFGRYDASKGKWIRDDDIDKYVQTAEILIGKKADNLEYRNKIEEEYNKYKKLLPKELIALLIMSIIVIIIGLII